MTEIQIIQQTEREILSDFIRVCNLYNLRYYLAEGSLLGAIRHNGMIPWDDDIDVVMFRKDYEVFLQIANKSLNPRYECRNYRDTDGFIELMTKVCDKTRFVVSKKGRKQELLNVWIDIFVIDGMPRCSLQQKVYKFRLLSLKLLVMLSNIEHYATNRKRNFFERCIIFLARNFDFGKFLNTKACISKLDRCLASIDAEKTGVSVIFFSEYRFKTLFKTNFYYNEKSVPFNNLQAIIPGSYDAILKKEYGDYTKYPPETDRLKHQLVLVGIENSIVGIE